MRKATVSRVYFLQVLILFVSVCWFYVNEQVKCFVRQFRVQLRLLRTQADLIGLDEFIVLKRQTTG